MLRLAGRLADGVVLNNYQTVNAVRRGVAEIAAGAEAAGRSLDDIERVKLLLVRMTRNKKAALQAIKPRLAQYLAQQPHIEGPSGADHELSDRLRATIPWARHVPAVRRRRQPSPRRTGRQPRLLWRPRRSPRPASPST